MEFVTPKDIIVSGVVGYTAGVKNATAATASNLIAKNVSKAVDLDTFIKEKTGLQIPLNRVPGLTDSNIIGSVAYFAWNVFNGRSLRKAGMNTAVYALSNAATGHTPGIAEFSAIHNTDIPGSDIQAKIDDTTTDAIKEKASVNPWAKFFNYSHQHTEGYLKRGGLPRVDSSEWVLHKRV